MYYRIEKKYNYCQTEQNSQLVHKIYDTLCVIEENIINKKIDLDSIKELLKNAIRLIYIMPENPKCMLIKKMQIFQLLKQFNNTYLQKRIKEYQQLVKKHEDDYKQLNLIENTEKYQISKAYIFDNVLEFEYIALSPNEKYLLVGTSIQVYLYDILTKLNIKIYKQKSFDGIFSLNSRQIILISKSGIIVIDINTGKKSKYITYDYMINKVSFINSSWLYLFCNKNGSQRIAKIDFKQNHQIFSLKIPNDYFGEIQFFDNLIIFQTNGFLQICNEKTRKSISIVLESSEPEDFFLMNKNEILCIGEQFKLIILNIDYQKKILIKNKVLPFTAFNVFRGNSRFKYFYLIFKNEFQIIDENYNSIYQKDQQHYDVFFKKSIQLNSDRIFLIFQKDGVYILKRNKQE